MDGQLYTVTTDVAEWIDFACWLAGRDLTREEWRDSLDERPYDRVCG